MDIFEKQVYGYWLKLCERKTLKPQVDRVEIYEDNNNDIHHDGIDKKSNILK